MKRSLPETTTSSPNACPSANPPTSSVPVPTPSDRLPTACDTTQITGSPAPGDRPLESNGSTCTQLPVPNCNGTVTPPPLATAVSSPPAVNIDATVNCCNQTPRTSSIPPQGPTAPSVNPCAPVSSITEVAPTALPSAVSSPSSPLSSLYPGATQVTIQPINLSPMYNEELKKLLSNLSPMSSQDPVENQQPYDNSLALSTPNLSSYPSEAAQFLSNNPSALPSDEAYSQLQEPNPGDCSTTPDPNSAPTQTSTGAQSNAVNLEFIQYLLSTLPRYKPNNNATNTTSPTSS